MKSKSKIKRNLIVVFFICIVAYIGFSLYESKYTLTTSTYQLYSSKFSTALRLVHLTDLHNHMFGESNQTLIEQVEIQSPDIILITGDMLNSDESDSTIVTNLVKSLCEIAPVYYSFGNHELAYQENYEKDLTRLLEDAGAVVMDRTYEDIEINGQKLRLGGFYGYGLPEKYLETKEADPEECAFLSEFQNTDLYTVLMCHMPVCWLINDGLNEWDIDCVFAGHAHGGQMILPGVGGLYAPDMGWFPGKLEGLYHSEEGSKTMVLSRGLGSTGSLPRMNNIPEIVVVDILPKDL